MMDQFRFIGYEVKSIAFENNEVDSEGGFLSVSSDLRPELKMHMDEDNDCIFTIFVDAVVEAKDKDKDTVVFTCSELLQLSFACLKGHESNDEKAVEACLKENSWFFQNFIDISVKVSFEKILSDTAFDNLNIPPCSSFEMEKK